MTQPTVSTGGTIRQTRVALLTRRYSVAPSGKTPGAPGLEVLKDTEGRIQELQEFRSCRIRCIRLASMKFRAESLTGESKGESPRELIPCRLALREKGTRFPKQQSPKCWEKIGQRNVERLGLLHPKAVLLRRSIWRPFRVRRGNGSSQG
jgi:hypothetical protein